MRAVIVKVGTAYRILQSNHVLKNVSDRYTLVDWIDSGSKWSRLLTEAEFDQFLYEFEFARRGDRQRWQQLFCRDHAVANIYTEPQDRFKDSDCQISIAKLDVTLLRP